MVFFYATERIKISKKITTFIFFYVFWFQIVRQQFKQKFKYLCILSFQSKRDLKLSYRCIDFFQSQRDDTSNYIKDVDSFTTGHLFSSIKARSFSKKLQTSLMFTHFVQSKRNNSLIDSKLYFFYSKRKNSPRDLKLSQK